MYPLLATSSNYLSEGKPKSQSSGIRGHQSAWPFLSHTSPHVPFTATMPRSHPPKSIILHLPPPSSDPSSSAGPSHQRPMTTPPTLQVLLEAQRIALDKGDLLDVESFMSPSQRDEWFRLDDPAAIPPEQPIGQSSSAMTLRDSPMGKGPREAESIATTPLPLGRSPKRTKIEHWKQRQKTRLASAAIPSVTTPDYKSHVKEPDRAQIQAGASYWCVRSLGLMLMSSDAQEPSPHSRTQIPWSAMGLQHPIIPI